MAAARDSGATPLQDELGRDLLMKEEDFKNKEFITVGGFATVYSAEHTPTGRSFALKFAVIKANITRNKESIKTEIKTLRKLQHKNIISLVGWFESRDNIAAVLELATWVLFDYRPESTMSWTHKEWNNGCPEIKNAVRVLYEIAEGMHYLNSQSPPVLHLDLKSNNVLVMENGTAKIADFGTSEESSYDDATSTTCLSLNSNRICWGCAAFAPPESLVTEKTNPSRRHDVYSYAIIMWEVLTYGTELEPYGTRDTDEIKKKVRNGERPSCEKLYRATPDTMKDLIQRCWDKDFKVRPRFDEIKRILEPELTKLQSSGTAEAVDGCAAAAESCTEVSQSQSYDVVDSHGNTVQRAAVDASNDTNGDAQALDETDAMPVRSTVEQGVVDAEADLGNGRRYAQEMGDVTASRASSNTPTEQLLYSDSLCLVGEAGAGKTRMVRSLQPQRELSSATGHQSRDIITRVELQLDEYKIIVNDFCGPKICRALLPLFSSRNGLVVLVYDMTKPLLTQFEEVKRWISAIIAVSPRMRLLVVGTHADLLDSQEVTKNIEDMSKHVDSILEQAKAQLEYHVQERGKHYGPESSTSGHGSVDQVGGLCCLWKTGLYSKSLKDVLDDLKSRERPVVLSFSCDSLGNGEGTDVLRSHILEKVKLKDPFLMEDKWRPFAESWLKNITLDNSSLAWTLERANEIFQGLCNQGNRESLERILCYLADSSYIVWLRNHPQLEDCIFHCPNAILGIVSKLFHGSAPGDAWIKKERAMFNKGILTDRVLDHLLGEYHKDSAAVKLVLQHCNLICTQGGGRNSVTILPYRLSEDSPAETNLASDSILRVFIRIAFETWVIPLGFFQATVASLISDITEKRQAQPDIWKNGISYQVDAVKLSYKKNDNILEIEACTELDKEIKCLWSHLYNLLGLVCKHIQSDYPGAMPEVQFVCPYWAYDPMRAEEKCHGVEAKLDDIVTGQEKGSSTYHCPECRVYIPRAFVYSCKPEQLSGNHVADVVRFLEKLRNEAGRPKSTEKAESEGLSRASESDAQGSSLSKRGKQQKKTETAPKSELALKFMRARTRLIDSLDSSAASHILDCLYSNSLLSVLEKEEVESESLRSAMIRRLLDITECRGDDAIEAFLLALKSDQVLRSDLATEIQSMRLF